MNKLRGTLKAAAVKAPGYGDSRKEMLRDIAVLTGGEPVIEELGMQLKDVKMNMLGKEKAVKVTKEGGNGVRSYSINIPSAEELKELVRIVNQFPCDVNLKNGLGCIDCKSLLGVLQMGCSRNMTLEVIGEDTDCGALENELAAFFHISLKEVT